jgi:hypothetical protein
MMTNLSGSIGYEARPAWAYDFKCVEERDDASAGALGRRLVVPGLRILLITTNGVERSARSCC